MDDRLGAYGPVAVGLAGLLLVGVLCLGIPDAGSDPSGGDGHLSPTHATQTSPSPPALDAPSRAATASPGTPTDSSDGGADAAGSGSATATATGTAGAPVTRFPDGAWPRAGVPASVVDGRLDPAAVTVEFTRPDDPTLFYFNSHDAALASRPEGGYVLIVHNDIGRRLVYRSSPRLFDPTVPGSWLPVDTDALASQPDSSVDTMTRVGDRYYAYVNRSVYTTTDVDAGEWTRRNGGLPGSDHGVYYDERGVFHLFYEAGTLSDHSGTRIGHATSPDGIDNWTVRPPVYTARDGYGVGDFDVVERDGVYVLFGDYTTDHPNYSVSVWVNDNLYTNFTRLGNVMTPATFEQSRFDSYGVQDADVVPVAGENRYVMYAHGHVDELGPRYLHYYEGRIAVDENAAGNGTE